MKYKYDYLGAMWEDIEESLNDYSNILERYNVTAAGGEMNGADFDEMFNGLYPDHNPGRLCPAPAGPRSAARPANVGKSYNALLQTE